jgi:hypothetical protein
VAGFGLGTHSFIVIELSHGSQAGRAQPLVTLLTFQVPW